MKTPNLFEWTTVGFRILEEKILDEKTGDSVLKAEVKWQHAGMINTNSRRYRTEILQREIDRLAPLAEQGYVMGAAYHPKDDAESTDTSHIWRKLQMEKDGSCVGVVEILPTHVGKDIQIIVRAGGKLGMSSRGRGNVVQKTEEVDGQQRLVNEVADDFRLISPGDFCMNGSVPDAGIRKLIESRLSEADDSDLSNSGENTMDEKELQKKIDALTADVSTKTEELRLKNEAFSALETKVNDLAAASKAHSNKTLESLRKIAELAVSVEGVVPDVNETPAAAAPETKTETPTATPAVTTTPVAANAAALEAKIAEQATKIASLEAVNAEKLQTEQKATLQKQLGESLKIELAKEENSKYATLVEKALRAEDGTIGAGSVEDLGKKILAEKQRIADTLVEAEKAKIVASGIAPKGTIANPEGEGKITTAAQLNEKHRLYREAVAGGFVGTFVEYSEKMLNEKAA